MKIKEQEVDMELSKAIDDLISEYLPTLKKGGKADGEESKEEEKKEEESEAKSKGKADDEDEKKEDEMKSKGKAEDDDSEDEEKGYYSKKSMTLTQRGLDLLNKAISNEAAEKAEKLKKAERAEKIEKSNKEDADLDFKKSVTQALSDLRSGIDQIAKRPLRVRKSIGNEYEAVEKSKVSDEGVKVSMAEVSDTMLEMVSKGALASNYVCEFNATGKITDPLVKSQVLTAIKNKKGLR